MDQQTIDRAIDIATHNALAGTPVKQIIWIPPQSAASNPNGVFCIIYPDYYSATDTMPWNRF